MQTVEMHFSDAIQKYTLFEKAAALFIEEIPSLTPDDVYHRCRKLRTLQQELTDKQNHLFDLMEFIGPEILERSFIGEFQRALKQSISTCDTLHAEILQYRNMLLSCPT